MRTRHQYQPITKDTLQYPSFSVTYSPSHYYTETIPFSYIIGTISPVFPGIYASFMHTLHIPPAPGVCSQLLCQACPGSLVWLPCQSALVVCQGSVCTGFRPPRGDFGTGGGGDPQTLSNHHKVSKTPPVNPPHKPINHALYSQKQFTETLQKVYTNLPSSVILFIIVRCKYF